MSEINLTAFILPKVLTKVKLFGSILSSFQFGVVLLVTADNVVFYGALEGYF
ncbi:hypothetical protein [uncultured Gammaproteobacteria bacterium]|nr:hypothetical protein [uncultured Gammaproteobacteria bacterium]CAC9531268.1 hypothetical protein [uncultured Gammaproteobacteria bacterium]CAC9535987.1 hypothetical protein [uncultured Gammaproteobacteria bacterium]CAC9990676.1 hypothetical protein [uncultured Gammaproteobacteria bacterium]VVH50722.1 hypothetical protein BPUTSESOX_2056 [uncultured Gammaproteobacteria bacterium]